MRDVSDAAEPVPVAPAEMDPAELDAKCYAHIVDRGDAPPVHVLRVLSGAIRHAAKQARSAAPVDGILLEDVQRYRAEPGDVVVAYVPSLTAPEHVAQIKAELGRVFDAPVIVSCGIGIEVVTPPPESPAPVA